MHACVNACVCMHACVHVPNRFGVKPQAVSWAFFRTDVGTLESARFSCSCLQSISALPPLQKQPYPQLPFRVLHLQSSVSCRHSWHGWQPLALQMMAQARPSGRPRRWQSRSRPSSLRSWAGRWRPPRRRWLCLHSLCERSRRWKEPQQQSSRCAGQAAGCLKLWHHKQHGVYSSNRNALQFLVFLSPPMS